MESIPERILIDLYDMGSGTCNDPIDKEHVLALLKSHHVKISAVESSEIALEDVIPTLNKSKAIMPEEFFKALASKMDLDFIDFYEIKNLYSESCRSQLATILPYEIINQYDIVPVEIGKSNAKFATSNPLDMKAKFVLQCLFGDWTIELCCTSSQAIEWAIESVYSKIHNQQAMLDLYNRAPDQSAHRVLFRAQKYFIIGLIIALALSFLINSILAFAVLFVAINIVYFLINPIKIFISVKGFQKSETPTHITKGEIDWVFDEDLPTYTILVPIYREAKVLPQIMRNLYHLNYPKDKLDIKILMEEADSETLSEAEAFGLFGLPTKRVEGIPDDEYNQFLKVFDPVVVPPAKVTTKPRACNYGLLRAKGELCVIYDAEDDPHPDQLRKAAIVFLRSENEITCLQSKLNFYNADENLLTKWFSIEYGYWYEFYLPGLDWIDAPIPLGGTSNHFRKGKLDQLGRWDPYNVTEDADLGIRIARSKLKTEIVNTYTYEEATITLRSWIRQRSRWYKGHLQTYLVHMRHPIKLLKDFGTARFLTFQLTFGGGIIMPLINPFLWITSLIVILAPFSLTGFFPSYIEPLCIFNLIVGNITYVLMYVIACIKRKQTKAIPVALTMPIYWGLISIASWRGLIQLIRNPFYWDKTSHGISKASCKAPR